MIYSTLKPSSLIVFDMDGVIIDVSKSYRETVRQTARRFFTGATDWDDLPDPLFSLTELAAVKETGGLNNDWDLTCQVIRLLCRRVRTNQPPVYTGDSWEYYRKTISTWDVTPLADFLKSVDQPLTMLLAEKAEIDNDFIAKIYQGDVGSGNIIKQIFQEIYLGETLFAETYGFPPSLHKDIGLNILEKLIIEQQLIGKLAERNLLAIATGRPRAEALYPLNVFGLKTYFTLVIALDDCLAAEQKRFERDGKKQSLSKPDPFMLNTITDKIGRLPAKRYYVGDMPDDMIAALRAREKFTGIGFTASAPDKTGLEEKLRAAGAAQVFGTTASLLAFFSSEH
ncbi:MAG: HAD hydrolase-like protein [Thermodesulfobacteriota bacterium]|nr:HAD hydrolase-like protein [Thermodesulfobacteriota bacterium]